MSIKLIYGHVRRNKDLVNTKLRCELKILETDRDT